jgi:hypothetical protein
LATSFQLFNLQTMSGVFPGTRTMVFQRVRVRPVRQGVEGSPAAQWARLLWYEEPAACVVELGSSLLRIPEPLAGDFGRRLQEALAANGFQLMACGSCAFWQPLAAQTGDGLPAGRCMVKGNAGENACAPDALAAQSLLALDCSHWQAADGERVQQGEDGAAVQEPPSNEPVTLGQFSKRAERESDERWSWWGRLRRRLAGRSAASRQVRQAPVAAASWQDRIVERSGVGAGTEPCFACQGRIANLGALAVASPEGDKETFSVWRCRQCFTYYLNDWVDRWERTDSLETEETYYRLAPQEALEILAVIEGVMDAEHPARRHERAAQRVWMLQFLNARPVLSHQIKQGR